MLNEIKAKAEAKGYKCYFYEGKLDISYENGTVEDDGRRNMSLAGIVWLENGKIIAEVEFWNVREFQEFNNPDELIDAILEISPIPDMSED